MGVIFLIVTEDGIIHYSVDNTPAMFPHTVTNIISREFAKIVDQFSTSQYSDMIYRALIIDKGHMIDKHIIEFREARGLLVK